MQDCEEERVYKQKVTMKRLILVLAGMVTLAACTKQGPVDAEALTGTWYEVYDPTVFAFDATSEYTFRADGTLHRRIYNYGAEVPYEFDVTWKVERNELIAISLDGHEDRYTVTLFGQNEMSWQRVGTTYSKGTWGSDWVHLLRAK